jgi:multidrug transporter EmrE-like cation transporter
MTLSLGVWVMLIGGVLLNATAQLMIKAGTTALGTLWPEDANAFINVFRIVFQPWIFGGLLCYVVSVGLWIIVLSQVPVSMAYPMLSIGYIFNAVAAFVLFREVLSVTQMAGIGVIILGVILITRP